jgi:hypothetical protein
LRWARFASAVAMGIGDWRRPVASALIHRLFGRSDSETVSRKLLTAGVRDAFPVACGRQATSCKRSPTLVPFRLLDIRCRYVRRTRQRHESLKVLVHATEPLWALVPDPFACHVRVDHSRSRPAGGTGSLVGALAAVACSGRIIAVRWVLLASLLMPRVSSLTACGASITIPVNQLQRLHP